MATYYAIAAGGNWNTGGTWSIIADKDVTRVGGATVPTIADTVVIDDYSGQITVDSTACVCAVLDMTGFTGTMTFTAAQVLNVIGNCTLVGTFAGTGTLRLGGATNAACALTLTQGNFSGSVELSGSGTKTLSAAWTIAGVLKVVGAEDITLAGNFNLTCAGLNLSVNKKLTGVTDIILSGGTWLSNSGSNAIVETNLSFAGDVTVSGAVRFGAAGMALTYTSGTITTTGSTLILVASCTLNTPQASVTWRDVTTTGTITLSADTIMTGILTTAGTTTIAGAFTLTTSGGYYGSAALTLDGSALAVTGGTFETNGSLTSSITGAVTFFGTPTIKSFNIAGGTLTCTTGASVVTAGPPGTLYISGSCTINTPAANLTWGDVRVTAAATVTLTTATTIAGSLTVPTGGAATFNTGTLLLTGGLALTGTMAGTSVVTMTGGTWTAATAAATLANDMVFGVNAIAKGTVYYKTGTMAYTNGTIYGGLALSIS